MKLQQACWRLLTTIRLADMQKEWLTAIFCEVQLGNSIAFFTAPCFSESSFASWCLKLVENKLLYSYCLSNWENVTLMFLFSVQIHNLQEWSPQKTILRSGLKLQRKIKSLIVIPNRGVLLLAAFTMATIRI